MARTSQLTHSHWGAFMAEVENGRLVGVRPFERDPHPSAMIEAWPDMVTAPSRIQQPMVREGYLRGGPRSGRTARSGAGRGREPFVPVSWDRALGLAAEALADTKARYGNQAIFGGSYGWSSAGRLHHARTLVRRFLFACGGCVDQVTNYSWGAAQVLLTRVIGTYEPVTGKVTDWRNVIRHSKLFVAFGGLNLKNLQVNAGGAAEHGSEKWLRAAAAAGVKFVVISPMRDDAPAFLNATWIPIRPNTDTALMLALAHTLVAENRHDREFLSTYCTGFEQFLHYLDGETDGRPKDAAWAAAITGIEATTIRDLARQIAGTRTMLSAAWSLQRGDHGEQPFWMLITLASMLGQIGLPGGGFGFGHGSMNGVGQPRLDAPVPGMDMGRNPTGLAIPVARIADLLLNPGATIPYDGKQVTFPDIKLIYWAGGNPFHHHQDLNRLLTGWQRPDTVIVNESWWTATARHADIVLPATTTLERNDIGVGSRDRFIIAMKKVIAPVGEARNDFDIFEGLAARLGLGTAFSGGLDEMGWLKRLYETARGGAARRNIALPDFDRFWQDGFVEVPEPDEDLVLMDSFRRNPEAHRLATPSGRIELFSETVAGFGYDDCPGHATWIPPAEWLGAQAAQTYPLHLLTSQPAGRLHSQMDPARVSQSFKTSGRERLTINPKDAASRGIKTGDVVRVFNGRGACLAGAYVSDAVMPGVVILPTGAWYDPAEPGAVGSLELHGNPNVLTLDKGTSKLAQAPSAMSALVQIEKWQGAAPPVRVFAPPPTVDA
jgi:biotin/methionine sulfoxide reductase